MSSNFIDARIEPEQLSFWWWWDKAAEEKDADVPWELFHIQLHGEEAGDWVDEPADISRILDEVGLNPFTLRGLAEDLLQKLEEVETHPRYTGIFQLAAAHGVFYDTNCPQYGVQKEALRDYMLRKGVPVEKEVP